MKWIIFLIITYFVLYATVWLHEIGHSLWFYRYGCKDHWIKVKVKPYIFFSTPGPVIMEAYEKMTPIQHVLANYGGIMVNAIFAILSAFVIGLTQLGNIYISFALWMFMTLHICEIFSYMFIGSIYLVSDMANIDEYMPKLRVFNLFIGSILAVVYILVLINVPMEFRVFVIVFSCCVTFSMCAGRIIFTIRANRQH